MEDRSLTKNIIYFLPILGVISFTLMVLYGYSIGIFHSVQSLQTFIKQFGRSAILLFILLQVLQVVVPILPGGISSIVGILMFGNIPGLIYSYIGLIIGDIIVYWLINYYGKDFARTILPTKRYSSFEKMLAHPEGRIRKLLIVTLLIPFAPDDLVCLVAGLTNFPFKEYLKILLPLKLWSVATYSFFLLYVFNHLLML